MPVRPLHRPIAIGRAVAHGLRQRLLAATRPTVAPLAIATLADLARSKPALVAEHALLRHRLAILRRSVKRPRCAPADRALLVLPARRVRAWRSALLIVRPATPPRWQRQLLRRSRRRRSRAAAPAHRPPLAPGTIALIRGPVGADRLWGAARLRGGRPKPDIRVATSAIRRYLREARPPRHTGRPWATSLRHHAPDIRACDFLPVTDPLFRPLFACFVIALGTRRVVHVGVARHPTDAWVARQLREATPFGRRPRYPLRDNDRQHGAAFARVAAATGVVAPRTASRTPRRNATGARFLGRLRRACLDHLPILGEGHLRRVRRETVRHCNDDRPHQGLAQRVPAAARKGPIPAATGGSVRAIPTLVDSAIPTGARHDSTRRDFSAKTTGAASPTDARTHVADSVLDEGRIRALAEAITDIAAD